MCPVQALPSSVIDLRRSFWMPEQTVAAIKKGDHTHLRKALKKAEVSGRSFPLTRGRVSARTGCQDVPQPHRSEQPRSVGIANGRRVKPYRDTGMIRPETRLVDRQSPAEQRLRPRHIALQS